MTVLKGVINFTSIPTAAAKDNVFINAQLIVENQFDFRLHAAMNDAFVITRLIQTSDVFDKDDLVRFIKTEPRFDSRYGAYVPSTVSARWQVDGTGRLLVIPLKIKVGEYRALMEGHDNKLERDVVVRPMFYRALLDTKTLNELFPNSYVTLEEYHTSHVKRGTGVTVEGILGYIDVFLPQDDAAAAHLDALFASEDKPA